MRIQSKFLKEIRALYGNLDTMEKKMYWTMIPACILCGIVSCITIILSGQSWLIFWITAEYTVVNLGNLVFVHYTGNIRIGYIFFVLFSGALFFPLMFFLGGGFYSGMPLFCMAGVLFCAFCHNKKTRMITAAINLGATVTAFVIALCNSNLVRELPSGARAADILVTMILVSFGFVISIDISFGEYKRFLDKMSHLSKHIDQSVVPMIDGTESDGHGREMNIAILFVDIVGFTTVSETMAPRKVAAYLNYFFEITDDCIHKYGGIIDKYIGDCVMCYWVEKKGINPTLQACKAADEIRLRIKKNVEQIYEEFGCELNCSSGINYGNVIIGEIGAGDRLDFTVIGDVINVASRLEDQAPSGIIYLSQEAAVQVEKDVTLQQIPKKVVLKGKNSPVVIYSLEKATPPAGKNYVVPQDIPSGYIMHVCGSRGSYSLAGNRYSDYGGETSCYIFRKDNYALIIDCGTGLQRGREILEDCTKIDILLTHVHYDHIIGLLDWSIFPKGAELTFYGNFNAWLGEKTVSELFRPPFWPVDMSSGTMISVDRFTAYRLRSDVCATFYPATHPNAANLIVLDIRGKTICIMADCEKSSDLPMSILHDCEMLLYDGMYEDAYYSEHVGWGHSTWEKGVELACKANVKRLVITHHNPRNSDEKLHGLEEEAKKIFPSTTFAKAGDRYII